MQGAASAGASSPTTNPLPTARVWCGDIIRDQEAERRTSPVAGRVEFTASFSTRVAFELSEDIENGIVPYCLKIVNQQVTQGKLPVSEEEITRIRSAIRQDRKLGGSRRAPHMG